MSEARDADRTLYGCPSCGVRITARFDQDPVGVDEAIEAHRRSHTGTREDDLANGGDQS
jgi:hypothetical protein